MDAIAFDQLPDFADRIKLVQLADRTRESLDLQKQRGNERKSFRLPLGEGDIRIESWLSRLNGLGYRGPFELELFGAGVSGCPFDLLEQTCEFMSMPTLQQAFQKPKLRKASRRKVSLADLINSPLSPSTVRYRQNSSVNPSAVCHASVSLLNDGVSHPVDDVCSHRDFFPFCEAWVFGNRQQHRFQFVQQS